MKDQEPRTLSRRDALKLLGLGGAGLLAACAPEPIRTILTSTATGTRFPTNAPLPSETATPNPSETPKPTDTPSPSDTPKPSETPVPEVDILTKLAEKGVVFPEDTSSHLETDDYTYDFRLSRGILASSGLQYVKIPERILKNMAEQAWGRFIFMQRDYINQVAPNRLSRNTQTLAEVEQRIFNRELLQGEKVFIELAQDVMKDGPVPFLLNNDHINGEVDRLEMNFVSREEFQGVIKTLDEEGIRYLLRPEWVRQNNAADNFDIESAIFIKDRKLVIYLYEWGWPDSNYASNPRQYGKYPPMERMPRSLDRGVYYMELGSLWNSGVIHLQTRLQQPRDGQNAPFDGGYTHFPRQDLMCIEDDGTFGYTIGSIANCRDEIDETFFPQR